MTGRSPSNGKTVAWSENSAPARPAASCGARILPPAAGPSTRRLRRLDFGPAQRLFAIEACVGPRTRLTRRAVPICAQVRGDRPLRETPGNGDRLGIARYVASYIGPFHE